MASKDAKDHIVPQQRSDNEIQQPLTLVQQIEASTKHPLTIQSFSTPSHLTKCAHQLQSPLFTLPAELREIIFTYATAPHYKPNSLFDETDPRRRPDHLGPVRTSTSLLSTCRRIWFEANHLPSRQAHHCFYAPDESWDWTDPKASNPGLKKLVSNLTRSTRPFFKELHFDVNLKYFGGHAKRYLEPLMLDTAGACPEVLTLTIRRATWPNSPVGMLMPSLVLHNGLQDLFFYQASPRLREIRLELENFEDKVDAELRPLVAEVRERHAALNRVDQEGNAVRVEIQPPGKERTWSGPIQKGEEPLSRPEGRERDEHRIVEIVWKVERVAEEPEGGRDADVLVPAMEFSDADCDPSGPWGTEDFDVKREWEERWDRERSLLKFVE